MMPTGAARRHIRPRAISGTACGRHRGEFLYRGE